jgi:hypothetical protein
MVSILGVFNAENTLVLSCRPLLADRIPFRLCDVFFFGTAQRRDGRRSSQMERRPSEMAGTDMKAVNESRDQIERGASTSAAAIAVPVER